MNREPTPRKSSSFRHTRAIKHDRGKRLISAPSDQQVGERLIEIVHPATLAQVAHFHQMGLRDRTLNLPIMVAFVLEMIWRQVGGVSEMARLVARESVLWAVPKRVSQQALSQRLTTLPAALFLKVLMAVLPVLQQRWEKRQRPLPREIAWARAQYSQVCVQDGSTLDALIRKTGLLRDLPNNPLAGRMNALLDLCSRLPLHIWYEAEAQTKDQRFWPGTLAVLQPESLLIFDLGYINFTVFAQLTQARVAFITRAKSDLVSVSERVLVHTPAVRDDLVWIGKGAHRQLVRLVQVLYGTQWRRYLTNELDIERLPTAHVVALYYQRWRIEDAYAITKRLLGLAYFWCGSQNAVEMQLWATWLLYAVLTDLCDAIAETLNQPFAAISMEMVYRSLYYLTQARQRGEAMEAIPYLAADAKRLGIVKRKRNPARPSPLIYVLSLLTDSGLP